jgi:spermidine/putrescine ABC transporter ATP-binding subunit
LRIVDVTHSYGGDEFALKDVSLSVRDGEFLTLLGPSGCGKTTLLRSLGGLLRPTHGSIWLDGKDISRLPAHKRPVNMVFQRVTLFPHLNVFENVAFGLKVARVGKAEIATRVQEALALVRLEGYGRRRSDQLSGGQMQRVALARALVNRPKVLLLDEPLSALDLKIRLQMEGELRRVHRETGATFIYVTHDQREALALSDRIAVFNQGQVEQLGPTDEIYRRPSTAFVARFVGDANVLAADVQDSHGGEAAIQVGDLRFATTSSERGAVWLVLRQEALRVEPRRPSDADGLTGTVRDIAFRGSGFTYVVELDGGGETLKAETPASDSPIDVGTPVAVSWDPNASWLLPRQADSGGPAPIDSERSVA